MTAIVVLPVVASGRLMDGSDPVNAAVTHPDAQRGYGRHLEVATWFADALPDHFPPSPSVTSAPTVPG